MRKKQKWPPMIIGWREWILLPDLGKSIVKAKIDTGARTSSIHAWNIRTQRNQDQLQATFDLHPDQHDNNTIVSATAPVVDMRSIKSSTGHEQTRIVILTNLSLSGRTWPVELTLARRDEMGFRMLLGRSAMKGHLLVDPARSFLAGKRR